MLSSFSAHPSLNFVDSGRSESSEVGLVSRSTSAESPEKVSWRLGISTRNGTWTQQSRRPILLHHHDHLLLAQKHFPFHREKELFELAPQQENLEEGFRDMARRQFRPRWFQNDRLEKQKAENPAVEVQKGIRTE